MASNSLLRQQATGFDAVFCPPQYATDNAMGIAVLTWLQEGHSMEHPVYEVSQINAYLKDKFDSGPVFERHLHSW